MSDLMDLVILVWLVEVMKDLHDNRVGGGEERASVCGERKALWPCYNLKNSSVNQSVPQSLQ
jgi:hypothetical protein